MSILKPRRRTANLRGGLRLPDGNWLYRGLGGTYVLRTAYGSLVDEVMLYRGDTQVSEADWMSWYNSGMRHGISLSSLDGRFYLVASS